MVAAWIRALTGVGPSIASGSQVWSGSCADLAIAPTRKRKAASSKTGESVIRGRSGVMQDPQSLPPVSFRNTGW